MDDARFSAFFASLAPDRTPFLAHLEEDARTEGLPLIRPASASFLQTLLAGMRPAKILEIGTAVGYSALLMNEAAPGAGITTIELSEELAERARENIRSAGKNERITVLSGDAGALLPELPGPYDFIFLDGPKAQYIRYLPELKRLLSSGGTLFADNILQGGTLLDSRFAVKRRDRTIHERLRSFTRAVFRDEQFTASLLPLEDGVLLAVKKRAEDE